MGHEKDEARVRIELERYRDRLGTLSTEQLELEQRLAQIVSDEGAARERRQQADDRIGVLDRAHVDITAELLEHRDRLDELARVLTEAKIRAAQLGEKRAAAEASALRLAAMDRDLASRSERLNAEIADASETSSKRSSADANSTTTRLSAAVAVSA